MIYKIITSGSGDEILIDEADLKKLKDNINEKLILLKQGIINPSFIVKIIPLPEKKEFIEKPIFEKLEDRVVQKGTEKIPSLADLMGRDQKLLNNKN